MLSDRKLGSGAVETSLTCENKFRGGDVRAFYCRDCGFIESEGIESWSAVTAKGLSDYPKTARYAKKNRKRNPTNIGIS
jgi:hypothetical protein